MSGWETISTSGVPPRLKSTSDVSAPWIRPAAPPTWIVFAASSSRWARTMPISRSPSGPGTTNRPSTQSGSFVLGDLVALRQVGIEVVLAGEDGRFGDRAAEREPELDRPLDRRAGSAPGSTPGMGEADGARARVRLLAPAVLAAAEHLRPRLQLDVDLEPDDGLPAHRSRSGTKSKLDRPLERVAGAEEEVLRELRAEELQPDRQPLREPARDREPGQPGHVRRDREDVAEVQRERVVGLLARARTRRSATSG